MASKPATRRGETSLCRSPQHRGKVMAAGISGHHSSAVFRLLVLAIFMLLVGGRL